MDDFKGLLNLLFWFLIYWFIFRRRKKKPEEQRKEKNQQPGPEPVPRPPDRPKAAPRPATARASGKPVSPRPRSAPAGKVPPSVWEELRRYVERGGAAPDEEEAEPERKPSARIPRLAEGGAPRRAGEAGRGKPAAAPPPVRATAKRGRGRGRCGRRRAMGGLPGRAGLRRAIILAELLGPPVSMRRRRGIGRLV